MAGRSPEGRVLSSALGGACGGLFVGLAEAALIAATTGVGGEYGVFPYAAFVYGAAGAVIGLLIAAVSALRSTWLPSRRRPSASPFASAAAAVVFVVGVVVARYHLSQRVFHEGLPTWSATGVAVHLALCLGGGAAAYACGRATAAAGARAGRRGVAAGLAVVILGCAALAAAATALSAPRILRRSDPDAHGHPNVILVIVDTLRADAVGAYGAGPGSTPSLDRLAAEGVRFTEAYSQSTWTRPSVATILTSTYPSVHGAIHKADALPEEVTTLAEVLRDRGYWTAGIVGNINVAPIFHFQQGFGEYSYLAPDYYFGATDSAARLAVYKLLRLLRERVMRGVLRVAHYYQDAEVVTRAVEEWLSRRPPQPFFLMVHYMDPHDPYFEIPYNGRGVARVSEPNPNPSRRDELKRLYGQDVSYLDTHLGRLLDRLRTEGLYDASVLAVLADHGEEFQEHGGWWHGNSLYEEQVRVPLIVRRPREPTPGFVEPRIARLLDVAPTLVRAAGWPIPDSFAGQDLFDTGRAEVPLLAEEDFEGNVLRSTRVGSWKLITANAENPRGLQTTELYDLSADPGEQVNRAAAEPRRVAELLEQSTRVGSDADGAEEF